MNSVKNSPNEPVVPMPVLSEKVLNLALDHLYQDREESLNDLRQEFNWEVNRIGVAPTRVPREKALPELESMLDMNEIEDKEIREFLWRFELARYYDGAAEDEACLMDALCWIHSAITLGVNTRSDSMLPDDKERHEEATGDVELKYMALMEAVRLTPRYRRLTPSERARTGEKLKIPFSDRE